ncbi:MAG TPA: histidine kinase dimerization/phospho-acceptor domain-containing protein, partial [Candidatus Caenarcaniphilales bacterium]
TCYYPKDLQSRFPTLCEFAALKAESYLGIPLVDSSSNILGSLAVMDVKPMEPNPGRELILKIFAARAGAELERKQADEALQRRAQVDSLLSSISRQFIDQDVDTAINFTLRAIAELMGTERCYIFEYSSDQSQVWMTHEWCRPGVPPLPSASRGGPIAMFPWFNSQLLNGQMIHLSTLAEFPPEAAAERAAFERHLAQSLVTVPTIHSGKVVGFLSVDVVSFSRTWSQADISLLKLVGELIAIGIARHKAEEALRVAKEVAVGEAARSADANRAKSTFLANMSHELRTPLNAILGFSQLMERDNSLTPRQQESLAIINRSGEHLLNLINDVLEMSKIEAGRITLNPAPFDLRRLLETLEEMFQIRVKAKQLSLQFEIAPELPHYVLADEGKLRQILINLLSNAVKFTDQGGVTLRARAQESSAKRSQHLGLNSRLESTQNALAVADIGEPALNELELVKTHNSCTLHFEVEDTGRGIAPEEIDSLFQPFVQTTSATQVREGTGLGLTISRQFVQLMGGEIDLI